MTCHLLIGADGVNSKVRELLEIKYLEWSYDQQVFTTLMETVEPAPIDTICQKFNPDSTISVIPLSQTIVAISWLLPGDKLQKILKSSNENLVNALNQAFSEKPICGDDWTRQNVLKNCFPLKFKEIVANIRRTKPVVVGHASTYYKPGACLVGKAAHQVHPIAGKGTNLGLKDIRVLSKLISECIYRGEDLSCVNVLEQYQQICQSYNFPVVFGVLVFHKLYNSSHGTAVWTRSLCSQLLNNVNLFKRVLISYGGGSKNS